MGNNLTASRYSGVVVTQDYELNYGLGLVNIQAQTLLIIVGLLLIFSVLVMTAVIATIMAVAMPLVCNNKDALQPVLTKAKNAGSRRSLWIPGSTPPAGSRTSTRPTPRRSGPPWSRPPTTWPEGPATSPSCPPPAGPRTVTSGTEVLLGPPFRFDAKNIADWKTVY